MLTSSSAAQANIRRNAKFDFSVNFLPYHDDDQGRAAELDHRRRLALGDERQEARGVQGRGQVLHLPVATPTCRRTGTSRPAMCRSRVAAFDATKKSGFYEKNPGTDIANRQLMNKPATANSKGLRFGNFVQGREVIEEELEGVFAGKKQAKPALDDAVQRGERDPAADSRQPTRARQQARGKAGRLPLGAGCRTRWSRRRSRHDRFLLLAGLPGGVVLVPAAGRVRAEERVRRPGELRAPVSRRVLPQLVQGDRGVQRAGRGDRHLRRAAARDHGRPRAARRARLQDAADLAVRGGARGGRRAVGVPVRALGGHRHLRAAGSPATNGTTC